MNIVEVLRQAKPGQKIRRKCDSGSDVYQFEIPANLIERLHDGDGDDYLFSIADLRADDWEIVKTTHKWKGEIVLSESGLFYAEGDGTASLPMNKSIKISATWEE